MLERLSVDGEVLKEWDRQAGTEPFAIVPFEISRHVKSICTSTNLSTWLGALADNPEVAVPWMVTKTLRSVYSNLDAATKDRTLAQSLRVSPDIFDLRRENSRTQISDFGQFLASVLLPIGFETQHFDVRLFQSRLRVLEIIRKHRSFEYVVQRLGVDLPPLLPETGTLAPEVRQSIRMIQDSQQPPPETPGLIPLHSSLLSNSDGMEVRDLSDVEFESSALIREDPPNPDADTQPGQRLNNEHYSGIYSARPSSEVRAGAVVVRKSSSPALQALVDSVRTIDLNFDTKFLASGLSVHERWSIAFGVALVTHIDRNRYIVKAVDVDTGQSKIRLAFRLIDHSGPEPEAYYDLGSSENMTARSWKAFGASILAYLFTDQESLKKTNSDIDHEILRFRFGTRDWSARYVCAKEVKLSQIGPALRQVKLVGAGRNLRPHDTRSYFQVRRGTRVPIRSYRTGNTPPK